MELSRCNKCRCDRFFSSEYKQSLYLQKKVCFIGFRSYGLPAMIVHGPSINYVSPSAISYPDMKYQAGMKCEEYEIDEFHHKTHYDVGVASLDEMVLH